MNINYVVPLEIYAYDLILPGGLVQLDVDYFDFYDFEIYVVVAYFGPCSSSTSRSTAEQL